MDPKLAPCDVPVNFFTSEAAKEALEWYYTTSVHQGQPLTDENLTELTEKAEGNEILMASMDAPYDQVIPENFVMQVMLKNYQKASIIGLQEFVRILEGQIRAATELDELIQSKAPGMPETYTDAVRSWEEVVSYGHLAETYRVKRESADPELREKYDKSITEFCTIKEGLVADNAEMFAVIRRAGGHY
jgi:hypothetical protein